MPIAEDFFGFAARFCRANPAMLLHEDPQILASCFACGMRGLALCHKNGSKAVLSFFEKVFALCADDDGGAPSRRSPPRAAS